MQMIVSFFPFLLWRRHHPSLLMSFDEYLVKQREAVSKDSFDEYLAKRFSPRKYSSKDCLASREYL